MRDEHSTRIDLLMKICLPVHAFVSVVSLFGETLIYLIFVKVKLLLIYRRFENVEV